MDLRSIINKLDRISSKKNLSEDAATIANNIKKAVVRWGTDEVAVYDAIAQLTSAAEWEQVKKVYAADGRNIEADIANDFGGAELDYVRGLLASKGIKSEILRIGEPSDHLTPVEPNTPPPPAAEPEGKSDDKDKGQQNTQVTPDKVDVATGIVTSTDPNTKAWEAAFGGSVDKIVAWAVKKYPKVTPELVKEYLKSTPPVGDDVATLNQIDTWAKDPGKLTAKYEYDQAKFKLWEEYTFKPLSYLIALATSYYASDPDTYRKVTADEVKEFLSKANLVGAIQAKKFEQGSQEAAMAAFALLRDWVKTGKSQETQTTVELDPKLKKIKELLDKAEGKVKNESSVKIAKSLVESFGYLLEDFSRLSQTEKEELDRLINGIRQQARTGDPDAKALLDRYNAIKNAPPNNPPADNKPPKPDNKPPKPDKDNNPAPPDFDDNQQDVQNEPPAPPADIDKPPDPDTVKKISLAFKEALKENPPVTIITDEQKKKDAARIADILYVVGKLKYVNEWDAVVSYCRTPLGFDLRKELTGHLNSGAVMKVNGHLKKLQPLSKNKINPLVK